VMPEKSASSAIAAELRAAVDQLANQHAGV
jgi:hypothetical protein